MEPQKLKYFKGSFNLETTIKAISFKKESKETFFKKTAFNVAGKKVIAGLLEANQYVFTG